MKRCVGVLLLTAVSIAGNLAAAPLMYVPTGEANTVLIIDLQSDTVTGRIDGLENAHGLAGNPNIEYLLAGSMKPPATKEGGMPDRPGAVSEAAHAAHHAGKQPSSFFSSVAVIDAKMGRVIKRIQVPGLTHHMAIAPDGKTAVAVHSGVGSVSIIDLATMSVVNTIKTATGPNYAVFSSMGERLYISNAGAGTVSVIDTDSWRVEKEFPVGDKPEHMVLAPDDRMLYIANVGEGAVVAVDVKSGRMTNSFDVGAKPHGIDLSDKGGVLFVSAKAGNRLTRIDLTTGKQQAIELQPAPYHLAYIADPKKLYVASRMLPRIWVIDPETLSIKGTIDIGEGVAHQMVIRSE